ncbi:MAG: SDR family oxidoreductase [Lentimicrobiaceae bacterium]|jgi:NAD(P)-dependent dehydrogenase (short-subunit alcohol dehydrogenase family)
MIFDFSDLRGKVAVITGGAGVIGYAICEAMASSGIRTAIIDINKEAALNTAKQLSDKFKVDCIGVEANVLDKQSLIEAKKVINEKLGTIDILINGAGGNSPKATTQVEQLTDINDLEKSFFGLGMDGFDKVFALNFNGTLLPSMVFATDMLQKQKGVILNISSMNSFKPLTKIPAYSAAKASVNNFTQWLAVHLAQTGIRVNAIAPGFFLTNQNRFLLTDEKTGAPTPRGLKIISNTPVGKYGKPEDLQGATLFLLSDLSEFITGIILPVDGGYSAFGGV